MEETRWSCPDQRCHLSTCRGRCQGREFSPPSPLSFQVRCARNSATLPGRSCHGMRVWSPDAPPCVTSALAGRLPSAAEWRPREASALAPPAGSPLPENARVWAWRSCLPLGVCFCLRHVGRRLTGVREPRDFRCTGFPSCYSSRKQFPLSRLLSMCSQNFTLVKTWPGR